MDVISAEAQTGLRGTADSPENRDGAGAVLGKWRDKEVEVETERGPKEVRKRKRGKVRMTARCSALLVPTPLGREAPLPVSFDNDTEMPVAPQLPLYTWMQEPTAAAAILCHSLFIDLPAIETWAESCHITPETVSAGLSMETGSELELIGSLGFLKKQQKHASQLFSTQLFDF